MVRDFIFLATAYEGGWPVLSLTVSFSHWQCAVSVQIIGELARGCRWNRNLKPNFCPGRGLNSEPHDWQSSTLTTRLPSATTRLEALANDQYSSFALQSKCHKNIVFQWIIFLTHIFGPLSIK